MKVRLASVALVALCLAVAPPLVGCGGNQGAGAADATRPPPKEVLSMPVRVQTGSHGAFSAALADGLARAGFTVQTDPSAPAEIILVPQVTFSQSTSAFQVTVNGRTKMHVSVSVAVSCGGQTADVLPIALEERWFKPALLPDVLRYEGFTGEQIAVRILERLPIHV